LFGKLHEADRKADEDMCKATSDARLKQREDNAVQPDLTVCSWHALGL